MAITKLNSLAIPPNTIVESDLSYPLTNFSSTGIDDNATSTAITINASENVGIGTASPSVPLEVNGVARVNSYLSMNNNGYIRGDASGELRFQGGSTATTFYDSTNITERMRIDSSGNVGIGTASPSSYNSAMNDLVVAGSADSGITIASGTSSEGSIGFADGTSGADAYRGWINYNHNSNFMRFSTNASERMRINSAGEIQIGGTTNAGFVDFDSVSLQLNTQRNPNTGSFVNTGKSHASLALAGSNGGSHIRFATASANNTTATERMRIDSSGRVGIGTSSPSTGAMLHVHKSDTNRLYLTSTSNAIQIIGDPGSTGMFIDNESDTASDIVFRNTSAYAERMRIDSSGNTIAKPSGGEITLGANGHITSKQNLDVATAGGRYIGSSNRGIVGQIKIEQTATGADGGYIEFDTCSSGSTTPTTRMTLDSSGNLLVNRTSQIHGGKICVDYQNGVSAGLAIKDTQTTGTGVPMQVVNGAGSVVGSITQNQSSTSFNTSSDYRLKENIVDLDNGIDRLKQIPVHRFNFIVNPDTTVDGFIAHEVQDVVPEAITGTKDAVDAEGNPEYQGIDQSKLVPLLTAALQEAVTRIETLEAEVAALKGE